MAAKKKAAKKAAAKKESKRVPFGSDIKMSIVAKENPRRDGTSAHKKFAAMQKFVAGNKGATLADVIAKTPYRANDYGWDKARGFVK